MSKHEQEQGKQMFQFKEEKVEIGTQILDSSLPSNIDFSKPSKELQGTQIQKNHLSGNRQVYENAGDLLRTFSVKGKIKIDDDPEFKTGSIIKANSMGFPVNAYDEQKSGGIKSLWESIVGYVKRQLHISNGYIYIFQRLGDGYMTQASWRMSELFKIFVDAEQAKFRFVFRSQSQKLINKNFKAQNFEEIMNKLTEEIGKAGLLLVTE